MDAISTGSARSRTIPLAVAGIALLLAAIVGAYLDWVLWPVYSGLLITIAAGVLLFIGWLVARVGHGTLRRMGLLVLTMGVGLVIGQNLGPSRESLIYTSGGTMTLHLTSPYVAGATGEATCQNVASETEFQVTGDPNMRLDTATSPFVMVYINKGDRWAATEDGPRKDGVRLDIDINDAAVLEDGKPGTIGMQAIGSSTVEASFSNQKGSISFADLEARIVPDFTGGSLDLAGTLEWTCGEMFQE